MSKYSGLTIDELFRIAQIDAATDLEKALVQRMEEFQDEQFEEANEQARDAFSADLVEVQMLKEKLVARDQELAELRQKHTELLGICAAENAKIIELQAKIEELEDEALDAREIISMNID